MEQLQYKAYDEFHVGDTHSETRTITARDVECFADLTGDHNAIHLDETYAQKTQFGHRIAHGMLVASVLSAVCAPYFGNGAIYMGHTQRFLAPVYWDDVITCALEVREKIPQRQMLVFRAFVTNQRGQIVLDGELTIKIIACK